MSIYASWPAPSDDDESGIVPLVYWGSNHLPHSDDERGGWVDIASIPSHITSDCRDDEPEDGPPHPWLRFGVNEGTVVLDLAGVELVHRTLGEWLAQVRGE